MQQFDKGLPKPQIKVVPTNNFFFYLPKKQCEYSLEATWQDPFNEYTQYRIRPNYHIVRLGISNLQDTRICGQICIYLLRIHYKKDQKRTYLMMIMRFFLTFFTKAYVVGTHLNCIDLSMQFKWVPTTYAFVKK